MKDYIIPLVLSAFTFFMSRFYFRKEKKQNLEDRLFKQINDLTCKYISLNKQFTDIVEELNKVKIENGRLKIQVVTLEKMLKIKNTPLKLKKL